MLCQRVCVIYNTSISFLLSHLSAPKCWKTFSWAAASIWLDFLNKPTLQVTVFIKACKDQIDVLKNSINDEEANSKGWLGIRSDNSNADTIAHKHGVV